VLGLHCVPLRREHEIDGVARRIDGPVSIGPLAGDANVSLVDTPGTIREARIPSDAFTQFWGIPQYPAGDSGMINGRPRSAINSSRSRYVRQYRRYHRTHRMMI
jgi:hypothetical protein